MLFGAGSTIFAVVIACYAGYIAFLYGKDPEDARREAGAFWPLVLLVCVLAFPVSLVLMLVGAVVGGASKAD